jgi:intein/homing endonuclease
MRKGVRKHFFNEDYFENINTEEKAYWLGFIAADGSIVKSSEYNSYRLYINLSHIDESHLEKFQNTIEANDIALQRHTSTVGFCNANGSTTSRIVLNSLKLCTDLAKYHIHQRKSYDIQLPSIDSDLMPHYLRGLFDGDGSYYYQYDTKNNRYRYTFEIVGASKMLLKQIQEYLLSVNIKTNLYCRKGTNSFRLMSSSKQEILKLIDLLYSDAHIYLDRKYQKINEIKSIAA